MSDPGAPGRPGSYVIDLRAGFAPLTFDRAGNPDGEEPRLVARAGVPALRLAVRDGAFGLAVTGCPATDQRAEVREPGKLDRAVRSTHHFALRLAPDFPARPLRFVAAQLKGNDGNSPIFAVRAHMAQLFVDWRVGDVVVEHLALPPAGRSAWRAFRLAVDPDGVALWVDGRPVTRLRGPMPERRFLKIGPYRDRHPGWGTAPAAIEVRDVGRSILAA